MRGSRAEACGEGELGCKGGRTTGCRSAQMGVRVGAGDDLRIRDATALTRMERDGQLRGDVGIGKQLEGIECKWEDDEEARGRMERTGMKNDGVDREHDAGETRPDRGMRGEGWGLMDSRLSVGSFLCWRA